MISLLFVSKAIIVKSLSFFFAFWAIFCFVYAIAFPLCYAIWKKRLRGPSVALFTFFSYFVAQLANKDLSKGSYPSFLFFYHACTKLVFIFILIIGLWFYHHKKKKRESH